MSLVKWWCNFFSLASCDPGYISDFWFIPLWMLPSEFSKNAKTRKCAFFFYFVHLMSIKVSVLTFSPRRGVGDATTDAYVSSVVAARMPLLVRALINSDERNAQSTALFKLTSMVSLLQSFQWTPSDGQQHPILLKSFLTATDPGLFWWIMSKGCLV